MASTALSALIFIILLCGFLEYLNGFKNLQKITTHSRSRDDEESTTGHRTKRNATTEGNFTHDGNEQENNSTQEVPSTFTTTNSTEYIGSNENLRYETEEWHLTNVNYQTISDSVGENIGTDVKGNNMFSLNNTLESMSAIATANLLNTTLDPPKNEITQTNNHMMEEIPTESVSNTLTNFTVINNKTGDFAIKDIDDASLPYTHINNVYSKEPYTILEQNVSTKDATNIANETLLNIHEILITSEKTNEENFKTENLTPNNLNYTTHIDNYSTSNEEVPPNNVDTNNTMSTPEPHLFMSEKYDYIDKNVNGKFNTVHELHKNTDETSNIKYETMLPSFLPKSTIENTTNSTIQNNRARLAKIIFYNLLRTNLSNRNSTEDNQKLFNALAAYIEEATKLMNSKPVAYKPIYQGIQLKNNTEFL